MRTLKPLDQITQPDALSRTDGYIDKHGRRGTVTLEMRHKWVSSIALLPSVPEEIRTHFSQAQNLAVYAWFNYQFHSTAHFMSLVTIEYALKVKAGERANRNFKDLILLAIKERWISDDGFSIAKLTPAGEESFVSYLTKRLPKLRNDFAHGTFFIDGKSIDPLSIAADFINQLFPEGSG